MDRLVENRVLDLIELSTGDVTKILCKGKRPHARPRLRRDERRPSPAANPARSQTTARPKRVRPAFERAHGVIETLYPKGVPDQAVEPNAILCRRVGAKLKESNMPNVSDDTILRAAGRRK
jgi:excisionase family DNA binding protein